MLKEVVVIVWAEQRLDSISTVDCSNGNVYCGIRKKLWTTVFWTSKSILISEASTNGIQAKVLKILKEVVVIVWEEERLDSISTVDCRNRNVYFGIRKNSEQQPFEPINQSSFLMFYNWYLNENFNDVERSRRFCLSRRTAWFHLNSRV